MWVNSVETVSYWTRVLCSKEKEEETHKKRKKQNVKTKARFRQEKTAISNMHSIGNRT